MTLEELKIIYLEKQFSDPKLVKWIMDNIERYILSKRYPPSLCPPPAIKWNQEAFRIILNDFVAGREVKDKKTGLVKIVHDFNLLEIFDRCDNIDGASALLRKQVHFFFQKTRTVGIKDNLVRRVKELCKKHDKLYTWKSGVSSTYGLKRWTISPAGIWESTETELYHFVYASLGEYVAKIYSEYSEYNSPEINNKDLATFLVNIFSASDKRLTMSQIMYVLGYELRLDEHQYVSLNEDTNDQHSLLETVPSDASNPEEDMINQEEDLQYEKRANAFYQDLPNNLQVLFNSIKKYPQDFAKVAQETNTPTSTVYHQVNQIKIRLKECAKTPYEQRIIWNKLFEKHLPMS